MVLACEQCRKRKVRCSGTAPCPNCQRLMQDCYFEHNRRRRGPRPKQARLADHDHNAPSQQVAAHAPAPAASAALPREVAKIRHDMPSQGFIAERAPPLTLDDIETWKSGLVRIIGDGQHRINSEIRVPAELILHLLLIFCNTVNSQQCPVLSPAAFLKSLQAGESSQRLIYAMCAASLRFSRHHTSSRAGLTEAFATEAREELVIVGNPGPYANFQQMLTFSVLSLHETYNGHGLQAWHDTAVASNLAGLLGQSPIAQEDERIRTGLPITQRFIGTSGILATVGQEIQSSNVSRLQYLKLLDGPTALQSQRSPELMHSLIGLFLPCLTLYRKNPTSLQLAPWSDKSEFMSLKHQLDTLKIFFFAELSLDNDTLTSCQNTETGAGEYILELSLFHAMHILLTCPFMPIAISPTEDAVMHPGSGSSSIRPIDGGGNIHVPATSRKLKMPTSARMAMQFPGIPDPFAKEAAIVCIKSARSITVLCRRILDGGSFLLVRQITDGVAILGRRPASPQYTIWIMQVYYKLILDKPPFLGYSLFLAGLVFINQLHVEENPRRLDEFVNHLKTIFTVLGALRSFYHPAHLWVTTLFRAHALDLVSERMAVMGDSTKLFGRFFNRFPGISEPPYCTMSAAQATFTQAASLPSTARPLNDMPYTYAGSLTTCEPPSNSHINPNGGNHDVESRTSRALGATPAGTSDDVSLLSEYCQALDEAIESIPKARDGCTRVGGMLQRPDEQSIDDGPSSSPAPQPIIDLEDADWSGILLSSTTQAQPRSTSWLPLFATNSGERSGEQHDGENQQYGRRPALAGDLDLNLDMLAFDRTIFMESSWKMDDETTMLQNMSLPGDLNFSHPETESSIVVSLLGTSSVGSYADRTEAVAMGQEPV